MERLKGLPFRDDVSEASSRTFSENFFEIHLKRTSLEVIVLVLAKEQTCRPHCRPKCWRASLET